MTEITKPTFLYHGTRAGLRDDIIKMGLRPRWGRSGNWKHTVSSNSQAVYLTTSYPVHFALCAARRTEDLLILEIRADALDASCVAPDEDFLEQVSRKDPKFANIGKDMKSRTRWFRRRAFSSFAHHWEGSLRGLGTCCYYGNVPAGSITRCAVVPKKSPFIMASDPTITLMNYRIMGGYYRQLVRHIFGDPADLEDLGMMGARAEYLSGLSREGIAVTELSPAARMNPSSLTHERSDQ